MKMRKQTAFILTALFLPLLILLNGGRTDVLADPAPVTETGRLVISEVCYAGENEDWIELLNDLDLPVSSARYTLSDRDDGSKEYTLAENTVLPGQRLLVYASEAGFSLKAGETLYLTDMLSGQKQTLWFPDNNERTCGPAENGTVIFLYPTPGEANAPGFAADGQIPDHDENGLYISEVSPTGKEEWVELYNASSSALTLDGWSVRIGEDAEKTVSLTGTAEPGAYTLVTAKMSAAGTVIELFDPDGFLRDTYETGVIRSGMTSGRGESGTRLFYLNGTPGAANSEPGYTGYAPAVVPSETQLYHSEPFTLTLSVPEGACIRYTTDGSEPTEESALYESPIPVNATSVIRACAYAEDRLPGDTLTLQFLFTEPHTMPVVCVSMSPRKWKSLSTSDYKQDDIKAHVVWYEPDGETGVTFPADIVLHGEASRYYKQKSYALHLRSKYGMDSVRYPFFKEEGAEELSYSSFVLRSSSQDQGAARMRDSFAQRAVSGLKVENVMTRPVILYVNGAYWGIYDFNEQLNQDYLKTHYGLDSSLVDIVYRESTVKHGTIDNFKLVLSAAKAAARSPQENYQEFLNWIDEDYFTDYIIAQTFLGNYDTPNQRFWGATDLSMRWRPVFNDIDRCLVTGHSKEELFSSYFNPAGITLGVHHLHANTDIFCGLRKNPDWCDRFVERYAELLCTTFSVERLRALCDEMTAELAPEMTRHIARWKTPGSYEKWEENVRNFRNEIQKRHTEIQKQVKKEFSVPDDVWDGLIKKYGGGPVAVG